MKTQMNADPLGIPQESHKTPVTHKRRIKKHVSLYGGSLESPDYHTWSLPPTLYFNIHPQVLDTVGETKKMLSQ